jgi:anti-sigma factor RsiW
MSTQLDILDTLEEGRHPPPGMLQASLDGELEPVDEELLHEHLSTCAACRVSRAELESAARFTTDALAGLGGGIPKGDRIALDRARWEVRRRRASVRGTGVRRRSAAAAAILVLVAGGAAAALPGSPLRSFFVGIGSPDGAGSPPASSSAEAHAGTAGVAVGFRDGTVQIALESAPSGTLVELRVVEGDRVEVLAPEGARFEAGAGTVTIDLEGVSGTGILVRIPAGPGEVILRSGLRHLVRWQGGAFQFGEGVPADPRSDGIHLWVPE